jgi:superfamily II DNA helicase RecQ
MQFKTFVIPSDDAGAQMEELNRFLRSHRVLEVEKHFHSTEKGAGWYFCVKYMEAALGTGGSAIPTKIDYKNLLDEKNFAKFSKYREIRKQMATEDAIPAFAIFTDEELSGIAKLEVLDLKSMQTVKGVGEKKIERFGNRFITLLTNIKLNEKEG